MATKISNPEAFVKRITTLLTDAQIYPAKRLELDKKIPALEKIRDYLAPNASDDMRQQMNLLLEMAKEGRNISDISNAAPGSADFLMKRILVPALGLYLAVYLYSARSQLPSLIQNMENLAQTISKNILPTIVSYASSFKASPSVAQAFRHGVEYWNEAEQVTWEGYESRLLLFAGMGILGLTLGFSNPRSPTEIPI